MAHGGHWILASYWPERGCLEIFDSLGPNNPIPGQIFDYLSQYGKVVFTEYAIQHLLSDFCGEYSL